MTINGGITATVKGNTLTLTVPLGKGTLSSTGKSMVLASTGGFTELEGGSGAKLNLTVIRKN